MGWMVVLLVLLAGWIFYLSYRREREIRLYHGVNPSIVAFLTTELKRFPLHQAVFQNDFETVEKLLQSGASLSQETDDGQTPLHIAAECGLCAMCRLLLKRGADIRTLDNFGGTPLHAAAACQSGVKVIKLLLQHGVDAQQKDSAGMTPLALAEKYKHFKIAAYLRLRGV